MAILSTEKRKLTYKDYLVLPDEKRYELIQGELIVTPSPIPYHQVISGNIEYELRKHVRENEIGIIFDAPCDVYLDENNVIQPDIFFISKSRLNIIGEANIQGTPDLIVEILSESTAYRDLVKKKKLYALYRVQEYWIIDPDEKQVEIYSLKDKEFVLHRAYKVNDTLRSPLLSDLEIELFNIFT